MKKLFCFVAVFLLSLSFVAVAETSVNLQTMTLDELLLLHDAIHKELANRNFESKDVTVPPGRYTVGVDIPAGVYTVTLAGRMMSMFTTYTPSGSYDLVYTLSPEANIGKLELQDGQTVEISVEAVVFSAYEGLGF